VIDTLADQLAVVQQRYPESLLTPGSDGGQRLHVPSVTLPTGWSLSTTPVWFIVPPGYPSVRPDCFFADVGLQLASGAEPINSSIQPLDGLPLRWFSWHLSNWNSAHDGLVQYLRFVERRLSEAR